MAKKRMYSPKIVESDEFLDMPDSAKTLYFYLNLNADDDGFVQPKRIMRMISSTDDNLKLLIIKSFIVPFESGVVVLTHWNENNFIRKDRYTPTLYLKEKALLQQDSNGFYLVNQMVTNGQPSIDKIRLDKIKKSEPIKGSSIYVFIEKFNDLFGKNYEVTKDRTNKLNKRLERFPLEKILTSLDNLASSEFHRGKNDRNWVADPDFLLRNDEQIDKFLNLNPKKKVFNSNLP